MAIVDTLSGSISTLLNFQLARSNTGDMSGTDRLKTTYTQNFENGTGAGQASCWLSGYGNVTQAAAITLSFADSVNPLSTFSAEVPTADPEGLKCRMILIKNHDATNYITIAPGAWPIGDIGTNKIYPGGYFIWVAPNGGNTINDGVDDEITVQANVADCLATIDVLYG